MYALSPIRPVSVKHSCSIPRTDLYSKAVTNSPVAEVISQKVHTGDSSVGHNVWDTEFFIALANASHPGAHHDGSIDDG